MTLRHNINITSICQMGHAHVSELLSFISNHHKKMSVHDHTNTINLKILRKLQLRQFIRYQHRYVYNATLPVALNFDGRQDARASAVWRPRDFLKF